jgi:hypothetical protein
MQQLLPSWRYNNFLSASIRCFLIQVVPMAALRTRPRARAHSKRAQLRATVSATTYAPVSLPEPPLTIIVARVEVREMLKRTPVTHGLSAYICQQSVYSGANCGTNQVTLWTYNYATSTCTQYTFTGCAGSTNAFQTQQQCLTFCQSSGTWTMDDYLVERVV